MLINHDKTNFTICLCLLCSVLLSACQPYQSLPSSVSEYQARIARVLVQDSIDIGKDAIIMPPYPDANQRAILIPKLSMPLSDFYDISGCELAPLIAQRNTALGKVEYPSRRLVYEATLLQALSLCVALTTSADIKEHQMHANVQKALAFKQLHYPKVWADLIQNSQSIKFALSFSPGFVEGDASDGFVETKSALQYLIQARLNPPLDITMLEAQLDVLEKFRLPVRLTRSIQLLTSELEKINQVLIAYNKEFTCLNPTAVKQMKILNNVMKQFFIQQLQPIASQINRYQRELSPLITTLLDAPEIHPTMRDFHASQTTTFAAYQSNFKEHVVQLQQLLAKCGLRPTAN